MRTLLLAFVLGLAGPALAQQAPPAAPGPHGAHGIPAAATTFRANVTN
jgi:hypothetical protein